MKAATRANEIDVAELDEIDGHRNKGRLSTEQRELLTVIRQKIADDPDFILGPGHLGCLREVDAELNITARRVSRG